MRISSAAVAVLVVLAARCGMAWALESTEPSVALSQTFQSEAGFDISLPDGWAPIPKETLAAYVASVQRPGTSAGALYDCGYGLAVNADSVQPPVILVKVANVGPMLPSELKDLSEFDEGMRTGTRSSAQNTEMPLEVSQTGKSHYDAANKVIWSDMSVATDSGKTNIYMGLKLTNSGGIYFAFVAPPADEERYVALFRQIVTNVKLPSGREYNPQAVLPAQRRVTDSREYKFGRTMGMIAGWCIIAAVLLGLSKLIKALCFRKPKGILPPPPPLG